MVELTGQAAMRITSAVMFTYDFIITLPSEWRLYRRQKSFARPSVACILFIFARYCGVAYIISTSVLFFGKHFTENSCTTILPLGGFFRGTVATASATVFLWRTWAIWQKDRRILLSMSLALIPVVMFSFPSAFMQVPVVKNGGCTGASGSSNAFALKWTFALVNLLYDVLACVLGTFRLIKNIRAGVSRISSILLADGLGFFFVAVIGHALNFAFLVQSDPSIQTIMVTFQSCLTSILAQRIITALSERTQNVSSDNESRTRDRSNSRSRPVWSKAITTRPTASAWQSRSYNPTQDDVEMKIQVAVDRDIHVDKDSTLTLDESRTRDGGNVKIVLP